MGGKQELVTTATDFFASFYTVKGGSQTRPAWAPRAEASSLLAADKKFERPSLPNFNSFDSCLDSMSR